MPRFSVIVPVYNRPDEVQELLSTLVNQSNKDFEVVIVEDGSNVDCRSVVDSFQDQLNIQYHYKPNEGQGFARNYGYDKAKGDWLIVFDSDCLIPEDYFDKVAAFLDEYPVDAYGGPDAAHPDFTTLQKAINQSMTSFFTTGGIRGKQIHIGTYHPRSFNMGISRQVYQQTGGYIIPFMGEDLEFSTRLLKAGFKAALIPDAFVYHKRRTSLRKFYNQLKYFGRARINLTRFHPDELKLIHLFPTLFLLAFFISILLTVLGSIFGLVGLGTFTLYGVMIFLESLNKTRSFSVALLTPLTSFIQLFGYGYGLIYEYVRKIRGIDPNAPYLDLYE
jgi:glycosyltransferase involved in cell wall biosynthesis